MIVADSDVLIDALAIAGICLSLDLPLLTRNRRHFERIERLRLEPLGKE
jgi:predicted nucleic acid-binding protein